MADTIIKKATSADVENILNNRMDFLYRLTGKQQSDEFREATREYLYNHISDNSLVCYIASNDRLIVSCVIFCIYSVIPKPSNVLGKIAYVFNVYTLEEFRGKGLATKLMKNAINDVKQLGVGEVYLSATDDGKSIYERLQFKYEDREMLLKLV